MQEVWKDIIIIEQNNVVYDFTGLYQVSNMGRIRSLDRIDASGHQLKGKMMKLTKRKDGYLIVKLSKNGKAKAFLVHRIVGFVFILNDDPINKTEINHISEEKTDNRVSNLQWVTPKENSNHGTRIERITKKQSKKVICIETGKVYLSTMDVQRKLGFNQGSIGKCCNGKLKTCGGYHWMYLDDWLEQQEE